MLLSGAGIGLKSHDGNYEATIVTVGAAIARLTYKGHDICMPYDPDSVPLAHLGKVLAPWPNRVAEGKYSFEGKDYRLSINEFNSNASNHGLVAWKEWEVTEQNTDRVVLETWVTPITGYPFVVKVKVEYKLVDNRGLVTTITGTNEGKTNAPYGVGTHPYITCDQELTDNCKVTAPFTRYFELDNLKIPTTKLLDAASAGFDFRETRLLGKTELDTCFPSDHPGEMNRVTLENDTIRVYFESDVPYIQLFTPAVLERKCFAVEPMSCAANAFNNKIDLIVLKPHDSHTIEFTIGAELK